MIRIFLGSIFTLFVLFSIAGCSTVKVRGYVDKKERVDQGVSGNAGALVGTAKTAPAASKPTRSIYVVEVSKEPKSVDEDMYAYETKKGSSPLQLNPETKKGSVPSPDIGLPASGDDLTPPSGVVSTSFTEYVVAKDDTLQKISKKFYNSYSKWTKIYEANRDIIKTPDFIKPGITIKIPTE